MDDFTKSVEKLNIYGETDVAYAALKAKQNAKNIGFSEVDQCMISTAVSELSRNILIYADRGNVYISQIYNNLKIGIQIIAEDTGPGILDLKKAMDDNYSSNGTLGVGLPGAKRLMDEFQIESHINIGTKVKIIKWM